MKQTVILLFSLFVFGFSAWAQEPERELGNVVFDQSKVYLDTCYFRKDTVFVQNYHFKNKGDSPVNIVAVHTGCPCVTMELPEAPVAPGEEGDVLLRFKPSRSGHFRHIVTLVTDGDPRLRYLLLSVVLLNPDK